MNSFILKIGCFLTGRNYLIVKNCSEASAKSVKKYLAAILIVSILWGFIGFNFTQRYIKGDLMTSLAVAGVLVFMVIHIERQIILSIGKNRLGGIFRVVIGIVMAIIAFLILFYECPFDEVQLHHNHHGGLQTCLLKQKAQ